MDTLGGYEGIRGTGRTVDHRPPGWQGAGGQCVPLQEEGGQAGLLGAPVRWTPNAKGV